MTNTRVGNLMTGESISWERAAKVRDNDLDLDRTPGSFFATELVTRLAASASASASAAA